jgi:hypothetical protein
MNDWSYGCIAKLLARAVAEAAARDGTLGGRMSALGQKQTFAPQ